MTKTELFLELAKPNKNGVSRWMKTAEFARKYKDLQLGNAKKGVAQRIIGKTEWKIFGLE